MVKAIFIDLDGTLVDTIPLLYSTYCRFLQNYGVAGTKEEFHQELNGQSIRNAIEHLIKKHGLKVNGETLHSQYMREVEKGYLDEVELFPGVVEFLQSMREAHIPMVVVTASKKALAEQVLAKFEVLYFFEEIITTESVARGKPHPDIYLEALRVLQIAPSQAIAIEDSENGYQSATGAGIKTLRFSEDNDWSALLHQLEVNV